MCLEKFQKPCLAALDGAFSSSWLDRDDVSAGRAVAAKPRSVVEHEGTTLIKLSVEYISSLMS